MRGKIIDLDGNILKHIDTDDSWYADVVPRLGEFITFRYQHPKYNKKKGYKITEYVYSVTSIDHKFGSRTEIIIHVQKRFDKEEWFKPK